MARLARPPLDPLCLAALIVVLVVGWCPLGSMVAIVLGAVGLRRVLTSAGARRGAGLAWLAIGIGVAIPLVEFWALERFQSSMTRELDDRATQVITQALQGDTATHASWVRPADGGPTVADRAAFAAALHAQVGALREVRITQRSADGILNTVISTTFIAEFERGNAFGNAEFRADPTPDFVPRLTARRIELDIAGARFTLPPENATPTPPSTPEPAPPAPTEPAP